MKPTRRGRRTGTKRSLSVEQEKRLRKPICGKRSEQLKMDFALWTRGAVMGLIGNEFGLDLSIRCVGNYLKRRGFPPQKPIIHGKVAKSTETCKKLFQASQNRLRCLNGLFHQRSNMKQPWRGG